MKLPSGFGISIPWQNEEFSPGYTEKALQMLSPSSFYNHKHDRSEPNYFPMLWEASTANHLGEARAERAHIEAPDDNIWFLGNEPEIAWQSNDTPEEFAKGVRYWKRNIGLPFAVPGILWGEDGRKWWDAYKALRPPKPDAYHIHIYAYDATSWRNQLRHALEYFSDRPLIVTECGGWFVAPIAQSEIMGQIFSALSVGEIQAAFWFSAHYGTWESAWTPTDCLDKSMNITDVGRSYRYWAHKSANTVNLPLVMG